MLIAVLGDVHGHWREAAALVEAACARAGVATSDLAAILQVGDAEPQRDEAEAAQVPGPAKYRKLGDFFEVVSGSIVVPAPMYFIAGNHEPFAALDMQGAGEWGPGVTYLGRAGVAKIGGLKVGFLSGIHGEKVFRLSEAGELKHRWGRYAAHYTYQELETAREAMTEGVDILITHDWPAGIEEEPSRFGVPGDECVRTLIDDFQPILSLHGHMHRPTTAVLGTTAVNCLAIVGYHSGDPMAAIGLWDIDPKSRATTRLI